MWTYEGKEFTSEMIEDYIGFVYLITDIVNGKKYVGKKLFVSTHTKRPLKGQKRKRKIVTESDWKTYCSSNEEIKALYAEFGEQRFVRQILHLCKAKGLLSYMEMKEQVDREVLFKPDEYYNGIIQVRINRKHVLAKSCK